MVQLKINTQIKEYLDDITWQVIADEYQSGYSDEILLVQVNGKLQELQEKIREGEVQFITARQKPGISAYQRSATLLMLKAFYAVAGPENVEKVIVDFSIGKGFFVEARGSFTLNQELLDQVKAKMQEYVDQEIPILKRSISTDDAIERFHKHRMYDKERLFHYRRVSRVNVYSIDGFEDYFYGYMVPDTSYVKYFDLQLYDEGFVLILPRQKNPDVLEPFEPQDKIFHVQKESEEWGDKLDVATVGDLNDRITREGVQSLMLIQEALHEAKISSIAEEIRRRGNVKFVMIAGPSSSGKTTFSKRLSIQLMANGLKPYPISLDDYFVDREKTPLDANGKHDFESLYALDLPFFESQLSDLLAGKEVELPRFNFTTGKREMTGNKLRIDDHMILILEGIHALNPALTPNIPAANKFKIYVSALTTIQLDYHNYIPTTDNRLLRRIIRDYKYRNYSAEETIARWGSVRAGEDKWIFPYQEYADAMFNSALLFELAVLKDYVEPILRKVPNNSPEYSEAHRLLRFLSYFVSVRDKELPPTSLLREFLGGSSFRY